MINQNKCYCCGNIANYQFKNGKHCCCPRYYSCPANRKKVSLRQLGDKNHAFGKTPWNKGLTKETDIRVSQYALSGKKTRQANPKSAWNKGLTKETSEGVRKYSVGMSERKLGKPNYKLRKPVNKSRAKTIGKFRSLFKKRLYTEWIFPILKRDNFCCSICKISGIKLEVHHLVPYRKLFSLACDKLKLKILEWKNWNSEQINALEEELIKNHTLGIGITVCTRCHGKIDKYRKPFIKTVRDEQNNRY